MPTSESPNPQHCGKCGAALSAYAPDGLCAACLLESAFERGDVGANNQSRRAPLLSFHDYEVLEEIARGGMGVIYRARQISLNRIVAIKMILGGHLANAAEMQRFRVEAATVAQLQHPNIVAIHEVGEHAGQPYFSMDLVEGRNLAQLVRDEPLPSRKAAGYLKTIAEAVQYAHSRGVLHRDLKPSNILIDDLDQPRITDFGLAKRFNSGSELSSNDPHLTQTGQVLGSPSFIPPEQAAGQKDAIGPASDVYSLGAILYHCLTARPPFVADTMTATLRMVAENEAVSPHLLNASVPRDLETICLKCLEKDPKRRYATAQDLADELGRFLRGEPIRARPVLLMERFGRWCRRYPAIAGLTGSVALLLVTVAILSTVSVIRLRRANRDGQERLRESLLAQAHANRLSSHPGRRFDSLEAIRKAVAIRPGLDLRNEAIAAMGLVDLRPAKIWVVPPYYYQVFDPRYERYARTETNGTVTVRFVRDDAEVARWPGLGVSVNGLSFSPDGRLLAVLFNTVQNGSNEFRVFKVFDLHDPEKIRLTLDHRWIRVFSFSPDSRRLSVVWRSNANDDPTTVTFYETDTGHELNSFQTATLPYGLAFNPNGSQLAVSSSYSSHIEIYSVADGQKVHTLVHSNGVNLLSWTTDGRRLAGACADGHVYVWDMSVSPPRATLLPQEGVAIGCNFSHRGDMLMSHGWNNLAKLWSVEDGRELLRSPSLGIGPFGLDDRWVWLLLGQQGAMYEFSRGDECRAYRRNSVLGEASSVAISQDGRWLASGHHDGLRLLDLASGRQCHYPEVGEVRGLQFATNGRALVTSRTDKILSWQIRARDENGETRVEVGPPTPLSREPPMSVNPAKRMLSVANGEAYIFDGESFRIERRLTTSHGKHGIFSGAISADGRHCVTWALHTEIVEVWDAKDGRRLAALPGIMSCLGFSPDGRWLITGSGEEYIFWDRSSWTRRKTLSRGLTGATHGRLAFTRDGAMVALAMGRGEIGLFDTTTFEPLATLEPPEVAGVSGLDFSGDGSQLALGTTGRAIYVWDLRLVRRQLAELSLDWNSPPLPPATHPATPVKIIAITAE